MAGDPWLDCDVIDAVKDDLVVELKKADGRRELRFDVTLAPG